MTVYEGNLTGQNLRIAIAVSRFNEFITQRLLAGALDGLRRHGVAEEHVSTAWVPGAVELPLVAQRFAEHPQISAVITLGAVIRGSTTHYDYVCNMVASGVNSASLKTGKPIIFGVITTETIEQAIERAGTKAGNKGFEAAVSAIEMANLMRELP